MFKPKFKNFNWFIKNVTTKTTIAITLPPFGIYLNPKYKHRHNKSLETHEIIHWRQSLEMLIVFQYLWYFFEWLLKLVIYGKKSYRNISFEREAWDNENNPNYLEMRKPYSWVKYLIK